MPSTTGGFMTTQLVSRSTLLATLEPYEHLLFEPMAQRDLDGLVTLQAQWEAQLGDSAAAIEIGVRVTTVLRSGPE
jgi:hypothetical protein